MTMLEIKVIIFKLVGGVKLQHAFKFSTYLPGLRSVTFTQQWEVVIRKTMTE